MARYLLVALVCLAAGCDSGDGSEQVRCPPASGAPPAGAAMIVMLGPGVDWGTGTLLGAHANRLVRISVPDGERERSRTLGRRVREREMGDRDLAHLDVASGPLLELSPDGRTLVALVREPAPRPDRVAILDPASLRTRCTHLLPAEVDHSGLLLGHAGKVYAFGTRPAASGRGRDAVLTVVDADTGDLEARRTLRPAETGRHGKDWFPYSGALSRDGRRLALSYHGGDTTGADVFRLPGRPARGAPAIGLAHGTVAALGDGFVATTGSRLIEFGREGRPIRELRAGTRMVHLMDLALAGARRPIFVSSCGRRPAIRRLDGGRRPEALPTGDVCGSPLAIHDGRWLLLAAAKVGRRLGYPSGPWPPEDLRLIDLRHPARGGRSVAAGTPLDALVVSPRS